MLRWLVAQELVPTKREAARLLAACPQLSQTGLELATARLQALLRMGGITREEAGELVRARPRLLVPTLHDLLPVAFGCRMMTDA